MGKVFGILLIVLGIWVGLEVMNEGTESAFDGAFVRAGLVTPDPAGTDESVARRAAGSVDRSFRLAEDRLAEFE